MSVTPPAGYTPIDTGPTGPFSSGQLVTDTGALDSLLDNANHVYAAMGTPLAWGMYGLGWSGAASYRDIGVCRRPPDPDQRELNLVAFAAYTGGGAGANLRVLDDGSTAFTQGVSSATPAFYVMNFTPGDADIATVILQAEADLKVYSWALYRSVLSGSLSDTPKASGHLWCQTSQLAADEPVPVELFNRVLRNPRKLYLAQPVGISSACDSPGDPRMGWSTSVSADGPHVCGFVGARHPVPAKVHVTGKQVSGSGDVSVWIEGVGSYTVTLTATATPSAGGTYQWATSPTIQIPAGVRSLTADVDNGEIWTVQILTEPA